MNNTSTHTTTTALPTTYAFVITVRDQYNSFATLASTLQVPAGGTRLEAFKHLMENVVKPKFTSSELAVVFFSLEKNALD